MIAAIDQGDGILHVIRSTGRVRLHIEIATYCGTKVDASGTPVLQIPDAVFTQGRVDTYQGIKRAPCPRCRLAAFG